MKKSQLKATLRPIVKECITEILLEQGLLSNIISEVVKGLQPIHTQPSVAAPSKQLVFQQQQLEEQRMQLETDRQRQLKEQKRKLLDAAGFKTDVFANTEPIQGGITTESKDPSNGQSGALSGVAPNDPGVDITGIMALGGRDWSKMI
ncbi:MAG: hypothetical protein GY909_00030 [Oligoflexia bacterium]|nr:hypothetical protein [Oligoflexia bacterium]